MGSYLSAPRNCNRNRQRFGNRKARNRREFLQQEQQFVSFSRKSIAIVSNWPLQHTITALNDRAIVWGRSGNPNRNRRQSRDFGALKVSYDGVAKFRSDIQAITNI